MINLNAYKSIRTQWLAFHLNDNNVAYFGSFEVNYIAKEIKSFADNKNYCFYAGR